jgi:hypothetical protein
MENPNQKMKHRNMRIMAYSGLYAAFVYVPLMIWVPSIQDSFGAFLGFCGAIIAAYMTNSNIRDGWGKQ